jgi:hypothetical protein
MLEEPEYSDIVRWGDNGDSFVVLEVCPRKGAIWVDGTWR